MGKVGNIKDDVVYQEVFDKFKEREHDLYIMGYIPFNPMMIVPRGTNWIEAMNICIPAMCECDYISPLPDTWYSQGAMIEFELSQVLQKKIIMPEGAFID